MPKRERRKYLLSLDPLDAAALKVLWNATAAEIKQKEPGSPLCPVSSGTEPEPTYYDSHEAWVTPRSIERSDYEEEPETPSGATTPELQGYPIQTVVLQEKHRTVTLRYQFSPEGTSLYYGFAIYQAREKQPLCHVQVQGPRSPRAQAQIQLLKELIESHGPVTVMAPPLTRKQRQQHRKTALARLQTRKYVVTEDQYLEYMKKNTSPVLCDTLGTRACKVSSSCHTSYHA